jgi:hypothetical protein
LLFQKRVSLKRRSNAHPEALKDSAMFLDLTSSVLAKHQRLSTQNNQKVQLHLFSHKRMNNVKERELQATALD